MLSFNKGNEDNLKFFKRLIESFKVFFKRNPSDKKVCWRSHYQSKSLIYRLIGKMNNWENFKSKVVSRKNHLKSHYLKTAIVNILVHFFLI